MRKLISLAVAAALVAIDQLTKALAVAGLPRGSIAVVNNLFSLTYVENRGAAFGIFQNGTTVLGYVSLFVSVLLFVVLLNGILRDPVWHWCVTLILAGGAGNCIDRFARGFVVDYLDFSALFGFPVFNFADCCVVCGTLILLGYVLAGEGKKRKAAPAKTGETAETPRDKADFTTDVTQQSAPAKSGERQPENDENA